MRIHALLGALLLTGCAANPQAPQAPVAPATPVVQAAAPKAAPSVLPAGVSAELYSQAKQQGYRAKTVKGQTIFCRNEAPTGSRIVKEACVSVDQLENSVRQAEVLREQMLRGQSCGKASCGGN
jgi:hypothetical protein